MEQEYLSIKQIADRLGTTKQRVYRCIKKNCINEAYSETVSGNTVLMYDNAAFIRISELLETRSGTSNETQEAHHDTHHDTVNEALYEALLKQLEVKDQQIEQLQKALDQAQKLNAMDKQKILELEDKMAATNQEQNQEVEEPVKKKWWQKIF